MSRKKSIEELEASGSARASGRRQERKQDALARRRRAIATREIPPESAIIYPADHARILREQVGYDPERGAAEAGCQFDPEAARAAVRFIHRHAVHVKGSEWAGKAMRLDPSQQAFVMAMHGWMRGDVRRYREVLYYVPRGNSKTTLSAALSNLAYFGDDEPGAEVFCAAAEAGQARILWDAAREMILLDEELSARCEIGANAITLLDDPLASFKPISSEAKSKHGGAPQFAVLDELHVQPDDQLYEAIRTGMGKRLQPMLVMLTTARWHDPTHICQRVYEYACKVRDGAIDDPTFLPVIYEAKPDDDWRDERVWAKANPLLGTAVKVEYLRKEAKRCEAEPSYLDTFKRLHLNIITSSETAWISPENWNRCDAAPIPVGDCFGGLDLASTEDLTSLELYFPDTHSVLSYFWMPVETARKREARGVKPSYLAWARQEFMELTPGNVCDYAFVRKRINELAAQFRIREIAFDRKFSCQLVTELQQDGIPVVMWGQGFIDMNPGSKQLERLLLGGLLRHGGHPVLRWNAANVMVERDAADNIKPSKVKSGGKIDGIVSLVMALGLAARSEPSYAGSGRVEWH